MRTRYGMPICRAVVVFAQLGYWLLATAPLSGGAVSVEFSPDSRSPPELPNFLQGKPAPLQEHTYSSGANVSLHTAFGMGLQEATTGIPASFTINLIADNGEPVQEQWSRNWRFMYVWIANEDQIFIAEVVDNADGTLTAAYESSFPGDYLIYVEEVAVKRKDEGRPIVGSPFSLTISGAPTIDVDNLPICGSLEDKPTNSFWRPGSWISSNIASARHGITRNGWVFQPKACALEAFSYEDLMVLANLERQTWLLVLGDSVFRGIFLALVDMVLAKGQKDDLAISVIQKCWGYADIRVGNLRITYQDMRLYTVSNTEDRIGCNNEKLSSGGEAAYIQSCKQFLADTVFGNGMAWPTVIVAPSYLDSSPTTIDVPLGLLPASWKGTLMFVEHMNAYGHFHWRQENPTMTRFEDVGMSYHGTATPSAVELEKMDRYRELDSRVSFMSVFPMMQGQLFQNEGTRKYRKYGDSQHFHYVTHGGDSSYGGAKMVESTVTEMLANIMIGEAVGSKEDMYQLGDATTGSGNDNPEFEMCTDCPDSLVPFHVKAPPELSCSTINSLPISSGPPGEVWDGSLCPIWCMKTKPVSVVPTQSGPVLERKCTVKHFNATGNA